MYYLFTGIKKGIVEVADLVAVNKSDGDLVSAARLIQGEYMSALKFIRKMNPHWDPQVLLVSRKGFFISHQTTILPSVYMTFFSYDKNSRLI